MSCAVASICWSGFTGGRHTEEKGQSGEGPEAVGRAVAASIWPSFGPIRIEKVELRTRLSMATGAFGPFCCYGQMQLKKEDDMYGSFLCMPHLYVCAFGH